MRIVFMGTPEFAVPSLTALADAGYDVVGVFTQPDRPKGRGNRLTPSPVKTAAAAAGIPVWQPERIRRDGVEDLRRLAPDLCVTAAFGQILSQELLEMGHVVSPGISDQIEYRKAKSAAGKKGMSARWGKQKADIE